MEPGRGGARQRQTARNDEHRRRLFGEAGRPLALLCECEDSDCRETIPLTVEEYDELRPERILHPLHAHTVQGEHSNQ